MSQTTHTVVALLEASVAGGAGRPAVIGHTGAVLTHGELRAQARRIGTGIAKATDKAVVALFFPMTPEFVAAYFAVLYAGKQVLPLNLLLPPEDLKWILNDAGADTIVAPAELAPRLAPLGVKVVPLQELAAGTGEAAVPSPDPDSICTLLYTSGTTGQPKGVCLTHRNLAFNALAAVKALRLGPESRFLACLPSFHTFAITATMLAPLAAGASLATLPRFEPEAVLKVTSATKADTLLMVPSMYRIVTRMQERKPLDIKLRLAVSGGEALPNEVRESFERVFGVPLLEGYGQTESGPVISFNLPWANQQGTVGRPLEGVEVRIVDPETQQDSPKDATGEIWVRSPSVMKGYHNRPEETARTVVGGWLRTGDMGEITPDGYLRITGRLREMIKVAGEMVFPAEVENALLLHPAVAEAGVNGAKDERKGEVVRAFVVLKPDQQATEEQLLQHCRQALAAYKVPRTVEFRTELPKTPTGKVLRRLLK